MAKTGPFKKVRLLCVLCDQFIRIDVIPFIKDWFAVYSYFLVIPNLVFVLTALSFRSSDHHFNNSMHELRTDSYVFDVIVVAIKKNRTTCFLEDILNHFSIRQNYRQRFFSVRRDGEI